MSDMEISALDHCTDRQLAELLEMAAAGATGSRNWLVEVGDFEQLKGLLTEMAGQLAGELLREVCSPDTPVDALMTIKSTAKHMAAVARAPDQGAAATLLYHLSIAAALAHHGRNISSKDPAARLSLYVSLAAELPDDDLAAIFEKAITAHQSGRP